MKILDENLFPLLSTYETTKVNSPMESYSRIKCKEWKNVLIDHILHTEYQREQRPNERNTSIKKRVQG